MVDFVGLEGLLNPLLLEAESLVESGIGSRAGIIKIMLTDFEEFWAFILE